jgi:hypothetical protein
MLQKKRLVRSPTCPHGEVVDFSSGIKKILKGAYGKIRDRWGYFFVTK